MKKRKNVTTSKNNHFFMNSWKNFLEESENKGILVNVDKHYKKHKTRIH